MNDYKAMLPWLIALAGLSLTGCDYVADTSRSVQAVSYKTVKDARSSWRDFFSYHPPVEDPLPQTRYCYQMQSDIVCYDNQQAHLTSKLIGYQDGESISWVQPGGGSLGASGGGAVALRPVTADASLNETPSINDFLPDWNFRSSPAEKSAAAAPVESSNLPPINSVATVGQ